MSCVIFFGGHLILELNSSKKKKKKPSEHMYSSNEGGIPVRRSSIEIYYLPF